MARVNVEQIAKSEALEHMRQTNALDLRIKQEELRKATAEAETAELIREHVRKHGAGLSSFPGIKVASS